MRITSITPNYNQKTKLDAKNNQPAFGNFVVFKIPDRLIKSSESFSSIFSSKKVVEESLEIAQKIANSIKVLTAGKVNVYRRSLDDMGFLEKRMYCASEDYAQTLYLEDNNGKDLPELFKAIEHLIDSKIDSKLYAADLFAPTPKGLDGLLKGSNLSQHAYGAKPEQMIKM